MQCETQSLIGRKYSGGQWRPLCVRDIPRPACKISPKPPDYTLGPFTVLLVINVDYSLPLSSNINRIETSNSSLSSHNSNQCTTSFAAICVLLKDISTSLSIKAELTNNLKYFKVARLYEKEIKKGQSQDSNPSDLI